MPDFGKALGLCWNIESIDLGYGKHITDEFFNLLTGQEIGDEKTKTKPGLVKLHTVKLNFLETISD